ncbi:hypothetical protein D3C80_760610 [compost metagenome]
MNLLTQKKLRDELNYNPHTGDSTRVNSRGRWLSGQVAGTINASGYIVIQVQRRHMYAHRLAWLWVYGDMPDHEIDHIDGNRSNNRLNNLRPATSRQNKHNATLRSDNTYGKGVVFHIGRRKPYQARICINGKQTSIGYFATPNEAREAYAESASIHFGEFANPGIVAANDNDTNESIEKAV